MNRIISGVVARAVYDDDIEVLKKHIKSGKRTDVQDNLGWTPLHAAVSKNRPDVVRILCQAEDAPVNQRCFEGHTPLYMACERNCGLDVVRTLIDSGADPNIATNEEARPLHQASSSDIVTLLVSSGAEINAQDLNGYTALHSAIDRSVPEIVTTLLASGADPDIVECNGLNPLMLSLSKPDDNDYDTELVKAVRNVDTVAVDGWTAMMLAANSGKKCIVSELIRRGADVNISGDQLTALHIAIMRQDVELFRVLWQKGLSDAAQKKCHSVPHIMLIHRWYVPERLDCFLEAVRNPQSHQPEQSFLNFLFLFEADNKLQPEMHRLVTATVIAEKHLKRTYQKEMITLLENRCPTNLKRQLFSILETSGADIGHSKLVLTATEYEPDLVLEFLTHSPNLRPFQVWDAITRIHRRDVSILRLALNVLRLFTPSWRSRHRFLQKLPSTNDAFNQRTVRYTLRVSASEQVDRIRRIEYAMDVREREDLINLVIVLTAAVSSPEVPSLKELARDVVRSRIPTLESLRTLSLPEHVINILHLRQPVNLLPR